MHYDTVVNSGMEDYTAITESAYNNRLGASDEYINKNSHCLTELFSKNENTILNDVEQLHNDL